MSTNFHIMASRQITFIRKDGTVGTDTQKQYLKVYQTPTELTYKMMKAENKLAAYFSWVIATSKNEEEHEYADDDWDATTPLVTKIVNRGKIHVKELAEQIERLEENGFVIEFEAW